MRGQRKNPRKAVQPFENKKRKIDIFKNYEANGVEKIQRKLEIFSTLISKKSTYVKTSFPEYSAKEILANYVEGRRAILDASKYIANLQSLGHKHRSKYLSDILQDMKRDSRISRLSEAFGSIDNLWRIIGNISNLQERAVRWYFNDAKFEQGRPST